MIATRFRTVGWVASVAVAALGCYLVSLRVAAERAQVDQLTRRVVATREDIRSLQTELNTRSRLVQLERWNADVLSLTAPKAHQYLAGEMQLASLATPAVAATAAVAVADASGLQAPAAVAQVAYRRVTDAPATRLVHSVSLDLDAPADQQPVLRRVALRRPASDALGGASRMAYLDTGGKTRRP
ncbi:hypothetical protein [Sphingomonas sp. PR090111-T3T-6A]|uniref:hypothetical protein n=1 Tax=Sphingomonas sp. PR090111-T3T-6A TaxID=685778 RepID=UPI0003611F69|nr:hypothetical protein [Sphingomonas sp. PR090111-T3T-6A]